MHIIKPQGMSPQLSRYHPVPHKCGIASPYYQKTHVLKADCRCDIKCEAQTCPNPPSPSMRGWPDGSMMITMSASCRAAPGGPCQHLIQHSRCLQHGIRWLQKDMPESVLQHSSAYLSSTVYIPRQSPPHALRWYWETHINQNSAGMASLGQQRMPSHRAHCLPRCTVSGASIFTDLNYLPKGSLARPEYPSAPGATRSPCCNRATATQRSATAA